MLKAATVHSKLPSYIVIYSTIRSCHCCPRRESNPRFPECKTSILHHGSWIFTDQSFVKGRGIFFRKVTWTFWLNMSWKQGLSGSLAGRLARNASCTSVREKLLLGWEERIVASAQSLLCSANSVNHTQNNNLCINI